MLQALDMALQDSAQPEVTRIKPEVFTQLKDRGAAHHAIALKEYSKALKLMRRAKTSDEDEATRNMLLACLLTICFENLHGSSSNALAQARLGANVFESWLDKEAQKGASIRPGLSPRPGAIENELVCDFTRFDLR